MQLEAVLSIEDCTGLSLLLSIVPAYRVSGVLRQSLLNLFHLVVQSFLQTYNIRGVVYERINNDLLAPVPTVKAVPPRKTNPNIEGH